MFKRIYDTENYPFLTLGECSYGIVTETRIDQILHREFVVDVKRDSCEYGRFLFITVKCSDVHFITFRGLGYDEHYKEWLLGGWGIHDHGVKTESYKELKDVGAIAQGMVARYYLETLAERKGI